jgi:DNA primase
VNDEKGYWKCFAGCGGGSVIDFYMQYQEQVLGRECDFKAAVGELAEMLL